MSITVVIPFCAHDRHQAERLLNWCAELGPQPANCILFAAIDAIPEPLLEIAAKSFQRVEWVRDLENIKSNWNAVDRAMPKSAEGPNSLFRQVAWHFYGLKLGPWLFLEPDALPCCKDWVAQLNAEYQSGGKPFMGAFVRARSHTNEPIPDHMSGVAVYPQDAGVLAGSALLSGEMAFDLAGAKDILPKAHFTSKIVHVFRAPAFTSEEEFKARVPDGTVLYHANKDGSLIPFLRRKISGVRSVDWMSESPNIRMDLPPVSDAMPVWEFKLGRLARIK